MPECHRVNNGKWSFLLRSVIDSWRNRRLAEEPRLNSLANLLRPKDILLDLDVASKVQLFEEIGRHMEREHDMRKAWVAVSLFRREQLGSTGLGRGVAIPHARVKNLSGYRFPTLASNRRFLSTLRTASRYPTFLSFWCPSRRLKSISRFWPKQRKCFPMAGFASVCTSASTHRKSSNCSQPGCSPADSAADRLYDLFTSLTDNYAKS